MQKNTTTVRVIWAAAMAVMAAGVTWAVAQGAQTDPPAKSAKARKSAADAKTTEAAVRKSDLEPLPPGSGVLVKALEGAPG